jgi:hypothetical protein
MRVGRAIRSLPNTRPGDLGTCDLDPLLAVTLVGADAPEMETVRRSIDENDRRITVHANPEGHDGLRGQGPRGGCGMALPSTVA